MSLSFKQIEVFRAVISTGSISAASKLLCVSPPAVSRLLSYTEQRLGFALFERIKGRLYPTPEAHELFREIERVYAGIQRVNELAAGLASRPSGHIRIVCGASVGQFLVPKAIARYREQAPEVKVTFRQMTRTELTGTLLAKEADIGLQITSEGHPNLTYTPIGEASLVCICPCEHPLTQRGMLTLADLQPYPLISYAPHMPLGVLIEQMYADAGLTRQVAIDVASPQHACLMVQAGAGVALVDEFSVRNSRAGEFVVCPIAQAPAFVAKLVHLRSEPLSRAAASFVAILGATFDDYGMGMHTPADPSPAALSIPLPIH
ncbi:LysR family transcriptional regulator [Caballeronia mineralivorans]|uniref:LysR family transcriptional regulator n=1 Tax=Caballeronia mineralivorans TaxID=2010198 RepID=UPI0007C7979D|nr:LysR substrate-binding domain-containing protein [Caballeronia mineralivorans]